MEKLTAAILANKPAAGAVHLTSQRNPNSTHDQCWELPANATKRPADWKSTKST